MHIDVAIRTLLDTGTVTLLTPNAAKLVARKSDSLGYRTHIERNELNVELCQGSHCHCRY